MIVSLAGFLFALFRELSDHAKEGKFFGWSDWFNTPKSWKNKHNWRPSWAFKTFLVWTTDFEHFAQLCALMSILCGFYFATGNPWEVLYFYAGAQTMGALKPLTRLA